jgi:predicted nucleotidyltransferase
MYSGYSLLNFFFCTFDMEFHMLTDISIKEKIKKLVRKIDDSAEVILFGSRARGTARPDSDWDILILLRQTSVSFKDEQRFRHRLYDLELEIGMPISTFVYAKQDWDSRLSVTPLHHNVDSEGISL